ncbi:MAG: metallophosphoesterase [Deltaproteobacteria bacterium]|nr:metallophosphoesterase [Deltaproteobacteria bacterium]
MLNCVRMHRYLIVSDLHLADTEEHADGWKDYKHPRHLFDDRMAELLGRFAARAQPGDELTFVLNGDIVDFDLVCAVPEAPPWPVSPGERMYGLNPTEAKSVWKLERVLAHHPILVEALARYVGAGHRVVYVAGNHDPEMFFPGVQAAWRGAILARAAELGLAVRDDQLVVEPWFFYVPGEIYAEHGHQYDVYTSLRSVLDPTVPGPEGPEIALPMGNLSNRRMMSRMGFFNPHASDYILNVFRYVAHWFRHYAFSRRSLVLPWFFGSLSTVAALLTTKGRQQRHRLDYRALLAAQAERGHMPLPEVKVINRLRRLPIAGRLYRVIREFWLDRLAIAVLMTGGTIALALVPIPLWIKLMVPLSSFPLVYFVYEWFAHGENIFNVEQECHKAALELGRLLMTRVVTFGHTHVPGVKPLLPGVSYVNTGTWAAVPDQADRKALRLGLRNTLLLEVDGENERLDLESWVEPQAAPTGASRGGRRSL